MLFLINHNDSKKMKSLKELCEGAWGYEPNQNDGTLDLRCVIWRDICEAVYDKCKSYITVKKNTPEWDLASWAWEALGGLEYFIDAFTKCDDFGLGTQHEFDRYYYWFKMREDEKKDVFDLYEKCLIICEDCEKWINDWKEPEAMRQSLEHRRAILETWKRLITEHDAFEAECKRKQEEDQKQSDGQVVAVGGKITDI